MEPTEGTAVSFQGNESTREGDDERGEGPHGLWMPLLFKTSDDIYFSRLQI